MNLIVNCDLDWAIGKNNTLLYSVPEDMKFFRQMTLGKIIICGRKTLESFPSSRPLPKRMNLVLTTSKLEEYENLKTFENPELLFEYLADKNGEDVFVCGGESVYRLLYKKCDTLYVTKVYSHYDGATKFFPNLDEDKDFEIFSKSEIFTSSSGIKYQFLTYKRVH